MDGTPPHRGGPGSRAQLTLLPRCHSLVRELPEEAIAVLLGQFQRGEVLVLVDRLTSLCGLLGCAAGIYVDRADGSKWCFARVLTGGTSETPVARTRQIS